MPLLSGLDLGVFVRLTGVLVRLVFFARLIGLVYLVYLVDLLLCVHGLGLVVVFGRFAVRGLVRLLGFLRLDRRGGGLREKQSQIMECVNDTSTLPCKDGYQNKTGGRRPISRARK